MFYLRFSPIAIHSSLSKVGESSRRRLEVGRRGRVHPRQVGPRQQEGASLAQSRRAAGQVAGGGKKRRTKFGFTLEAGICQLHG